MKKRLRQKVSDISTYRESFEANDSCFKEKKTDWRLARERKLGGPFIGQYKCRLCSDEPVHESVQYMNPVVVCTPVFLRVAIS